MHQFQKLTVWQKSMDLTTAVYSATSDFPDSERFGLTSQMRRAAVSVPSNIAEGSGRNSDKEFKYHLAIAAGSASELFTQTLLAENLKYLTGEKRELINSEINHILKMLFRLQASLS